jgi:hypothetical protein
MIDSFRFALALGPLAIYFVLLGAVNLARRPLLVSGTRDTAALLLAISGLLVVGPLELLMPRHLLAALGAYAWLLWLGFCGLTILLAVLLEAPRLVVYNLSPAELRPILDEVAQSLDPAARWAGESLLLPALGVQLHLDGLAPLRNASLAAVGTRQSLEGWHALEQALAAALARHETLPNPRGAALLCAGLALLAAVGIKWFSNPQELSQGFKDLFRL